MLHRGSVERDGSMACAAVSVPTFVAPDLSSPLGPSIQGLTVSRKPVARDVPVGAKSCRGPVMGPPVAGPEMWSSEALKRV